jgi:asparagine synthase (glutamine-hydrolysing)
MCGIAGVLGTSIEKKQEVVGEMVKQITHRGPDEDGFFVDKNVGLGMRRLSIIDLSTGKQPITSADRKSLIFFNGEIYNYKELRDELVKRGSKFKTQTDTEVILHMYEAYGEEMLPRLRGMFSFCIYNLETKRVFLARDFFGIKPLYYLEKKGKIVAFSSEIKSFLKFPGFSPEVNDNAVYNYLSFQYNPLTETFFNNIYKLPPAHYLKMNVETGDVEVKRYWSFEFSQEENLDETKTKEEISKTIMDSVEHHMIADVPVGAFLSGGVDSSIITTLMQQARSKDVNPASPEATQDGRIRTFTVGFDTLTEAKESAETSNFLGTDHMEIKIGPKEYFESLEDATYHFDEPVADPSAIGLYFLAREARKHVKVVLSGEGADELFGGYNIYLAPFASAKLAWLPKTIVKLLLRLPFEGFGMNYLRRVHDKLEDWYIGNASIFKKEEIELLWKKKKESTSLISLKPLYKKVSGLSPSTQMQYIDIHSWLVGDILAKADKMTMAHSLELRVPFLDTKVAALASILPDSFKWRDGTTKYLLREAFKDIIPESTRKRKKLGFPTPIRDWLTADRIEVYDRILKNKYIKSHMNTDYILKLINDHTSLRKDNSRKIYLLLMLALWYDKFIK